MIPYRLGMTYHLVTTSFEIGVCPWPDLSSLFQYTSPTPVVSLHLISRIQYHPGIPVTRLTGSSFITTITFLILSYFERYKHNWYFSRDRYSLKLSQSGNTCLRKKKYLARNQYHNRISRAHPFKAKGKMCIDRFLNVIRPRFHVPCLLVKL